MHIHIANKYSKSSKNNLITKMHYFGKILNKFSCAFVVLQAKK